MKRLLATVVLSGLFGYYSPALAGTTRGARCHDAVCFEAQRAIWREAIAHADGKYAHRLDKMLASWTRAGFPDDFILNHYLKIHREFYAEVKKAGDVWFFEVQGYDPAVTKAMVTDIVKEAETTINVAEIDLWLKQSGL